MVLSRNHPKHYGADGTDRIFKPLVMQQQDRQMGRVSRNSFEGVSLLMGAACKTQNDENCLKLSTPKHGQGQIICTLFEPEMLPTLQTF